jgi:WD40 repeat protein
MRRIRIPLLLLALAVTRLLRAAEPASPPDFAPVAQILHKHCLDCHAAQDPENNLVLENFETLMKGGDAGKAIVPGKSADSLLVKSIEGRDGKKLMPPGKRAKLTPREVAIVRAWIDAGAPAPKSSAAFAPRALKVPRIAPKVQPRRAIHALAHSPAAGLVAVARYGEVELVSADTGAVVRTLPGHRGHVNTAAFSRGGALLGTGAGEAGLFGEAKLWDARTGECVRTVEGHVDALYSIAISPDGRTFATGSYDQKIRLWNVAGGRELRVLSGHNGAVFGLAFRPDGTVLASVSADRTLKLWEVASGRRLDTRPEALKELYAVAFTPDGKRLVTAGVDNRIRLYAVSDSALDGTNELLESRFAHEGAILSLVFSEDGARLATSAEDRTVKLWEPATLTERLLFELQPDQAPGVAFGRPRQGGAALVLGRLDGSLQFYDAQTGKPLATPAANR